MIKMGELIETKKYYHSRCGNVVFIEEEKELKDADGRLVSVFKGRIVDTINGHKILANKTHWFDDKGKWLKYPGGIHDLVKLCADHDKKAIKEEKKEEKKDKKKDGKK